MPLFPSQLPLLRRKASRDTREKPTAPPARRGICPGLPFATSLLLLASSFALGGPAPKDIVTGTLSRSPDPVGGKDEDSTLELSIVTRFVLEPRPGKFPPYLPRLKAYIHLPYETIFIPPSLRETLELEFDPGESPFALGPVSHVVAVPVEGRSLSFPIRLQPVPDELLERWIHLKLVPPALPPPGSSASSTDDSSLGAGWKIREENNAQNRQAPSPQPDPSAPARPGIHTDGSCSRAGLGLSAVAGRDQGEFSWVSLHCYVDGPREARRLYAILGHSRDASLKSDGLPGLAEHGGSYALIDLARLAPGSLPEAELRGFGKRTSTRVRFGISRRETPRRRNFFKLGIGTSHRGYSTLAARQTQAAADGFLQLETMHPGRNLRLGAEFEFSGFSYLRFAGADGSTKAVSDGGTRAYVDFRIPSCPLELLEISCRARAGGRAWGLLSGSAALGPGAWVYGPFVQLDLGDASEEKSRHEAYARLALLAGGGPSLGFSNREITAGVRLQLNSRRAARGVFFRAEWSRIELPDANAATTTRVGALVDFELSNQLNWPVSL